MDSTIVAAYTLCDDLLMEVLTEMVDKVIRLGYNISPSNRIQERL